MPTAVPAPVRVAFPRRRPSAVPPPSGVAAGGAFEPAHPAQPSGGRCRSHWRLLPGGGHWRRRGRGRQAARRRGLPQESVRERGWGQANGHCRHWLASLRHAAISANPESSLSASGGAASPCSLIGQRWLPPPRGWWWRRGGRGEGAEAAMSQTSVSPPV